MMNSNLLPYNSLIDFPKLINMALLWHFML